jgi:ribosomal protein S18 acetylase RimI-like enzyme
LPIVGCRCNPRVAYILTVDHAARLRALYEAFNARDIDVVLAALAPDVDWPNAWEGGRLRGHDEVRAYWTRQFAEIDGRVDPVAITERPDGRLAVDVHQVVRTPDGELVSDGYVVHVYEHRDGLFTRMDVEQPAPSIEQLGVEDVDQLRDLWVQLHHHHQTVSPVGPFVDDESSWSARRRGYVEILMAGGFALVARVEGALVGYVLVRMHEGPDDSWQLGDRYAEVWTLVVDEHHRGHGIGSALLDEVDARLAREGVHGLVIGVMVGNDDAQRLYEGRGLTPGWLQLYRTAPDSQRSSSG